MERKLVFSPLNQVQGKGFTFGMDRVEFAAFRAAQDRLQTWEREALRYIVNDWLRSKKFLNDSMYSNLEDEDEPSAAAEEEFPPIRFGRGHGGESAPLQGVGGAGASARRGKRGR